MSLEVITIKQQFMSIDWTIGLKHIKETNFNCKVNLHKLGLNHT